MLHCIINTTVYLALLSAFWIRPSSPDLTTERLMVAPSCSFPSSTFSPSLYKLGPSFGCGRSPSLEEKVSSVLAVRAPIGERTNLVPKMRL